MKKLLLGIILCGYQQQMMAHEIRSEMYSPGFLYDIWDIALNHSPLLVCFFFMGIVLAISYCKFNYNKKNKHRNVFSEVVQQKVCERSMGITITPDIISSDPVQAKLKLAFTYYKSDNFCSSRDLLEQIKIEGDTQQQSQAEQLLKQMNKVS